MDETESLNRAIQEEVALFPYDAAWPTLFKQERDRLLDLFPDEFLAIEHIGSTAVPGLSAKPIIDILAGVESMHRADDLLEPLCRAKYATSMEYSASLVGRRWLMRWAEGRRTPHLDLMVYDGKSGIGDWLFAIDCALILNWRSGMRKRSACGRRSSRQTEKPIRRRKGISLNRRSRMLLNHSSQCRVCFADLSTVTLSASNEMGG